MGGASRPLLQQLHWYAGLHSPTARTFQPQLFFYLGHHCLMGLATLMANQERNGRHPAAWWPCLRNPVSKSAQGGRLASIFAPCIHRHAPPQASQPVPLWIFAGAGLECLLHARGASVRQLLCRVHNNWANGLVNGRCRVCDSRLNVGCQATAPGCSPWPVHHCLYLDP